MNFLKALRQSISYKVANSDGDTIVEVMICLAIVATLLGGAFTLTRNSRLGVRNSQEHTEAIKVIENQIEQLRANAAGDESIFTQTSDFCMANEEPQATDPSNLPTTSSADCLQDSTGNPIGNSDEQPQFAIDINDCNNDLDCNPISDSDLYTVTVTWDQISGGTGQESMVYRLYNNAGDAAFTGQTCPGTCTTGQAHDKRATYHWSRTFTNITPKWEASLITGCTWDWGDMNGGGDDAINPAVGCQPDDTITHIFIPPAGFPFAKYPPAPLTNAQVAECGKVNYQVTLTEHLSNGTSPTYQKTIELPKCFVGSSL